MRHNYRDHFRSFAKNLFLGESFRVFAEKPENDGPEQVSQSPEAQRGRETTDEMLDREPESVPNKVSSVVERMKPNPKLKLNTLDEYQLLAANYEYFYNLRVKLEKDKKELEDGTNGAEDMEDRLKTIPWSVRVEKLKEHLRQVGKLKQMNPLIDIDSMLKQLVSENVDLGKVFEALDMLIPQLEQARGQAFQKIHNELLDTYISQVDVIKEKWGTVDPIYKGHADFMVKALTEQQSQIGLQKDEDVTGLTTLQQQQALSGLKQFKDYLTQQEKNIEDFIVDIDGAKKPNQVEGEFKALKEKRKTQFDAQWASYKERVRSSLNKLDELERLASSMEIDETDKKNILEKVQKERLNLQLSIGESGLAEDHEDYKLSFEEELDHLFYSKDPWQTKNADGDWEDIVIEGKGGKFTPQVGILNNLTLLHDDYLHPSQKAVLANNLSDSIANASNILDKFSQNDEVGLAELEQSIVEQIGGLGAIRNIPGAKYKVKFASAYDIYQMFKYAQEAVKRSYDRAQEQRVGELGKDLFQPLERFGKGPLKHLSVISGDLGKKGDAAENQGVDFYKNEYQTRDSFEVIALARKAQNQDQLKACLLLLSERGRLNLKDPEILGRINEFQKRVEFKKDKIALYYADNGTFEKEMKEALIHIYGDADFLRTLMSSNASSIKSEMDKFSNELIELSRKPKGIEGLSKDLLTRHMKGEQIDPIYYEAAIVFGIKDGDYAPLAMGMYYLIQGAAQGILSLDRMSAIYANETNNYPAVEIFREKFNTLGNYQKWGLINKASKTKAEPGPEFYAWYQTFVMNDVNVVNRLTKAGSQKVDGDHDLKPFLYPYMSEGFIDNVLKKDDSGVQLQETAINSTSQTQHIAIRNSIVNFNAIDEMTGGSARARLTNVISNFIKWDAVMHSKMHPRKGYVRWTEGMKSQPPRMGGAIKNIHWSEPEGEAKPFKRCYDHVTSMHGILSKLHPEIFGMIFAENPMEKPEFDRMNELIQPYGISLSPFPNDATQFYGQIYKIVDAIIGRDIQKKSGPFYDLMAELQAQSPTYQQQGHPDVSAEQSDHPSNASQESDMLGNMNWYGYTNLVKKDLEERADPRGARVSTPFV